MYLFSSVRCCAQYWPLSTLTRCSTIRPNSPRRKNGRKETAVVVLLFLLMLFVAWVGLVVGYCYCCSCCFPFFSPCQSNKTVAQRTSASYRPFISFLCPRLFVAPFFGCFSYLFPYLFSDVCECGVDKNSFSQRVVIVGHFRLFFSAPIECVPHFPSSVFQW